MLLVDFQRSKLVVEGALLCCAVSKLEVSTLPRAQNNKLTAVTNGCRHNIP